MTESLFVQRENNGWKCKFYGEYYHNTPKFECAIRNRLPGQKINRCVIADPAACSVYLHVSTSRRETNEHVDEIVRQLEEAKEAANKKLLETWKKLKKEAEEEGVNNE